MKNKLLILAVVLAIAALAFLLYKGDSDETPGKLTIAEGSQPIAAPIYIANEKGYFKDEGLDVELVPFPTGKLCLDALIGGKADFATAAETPIMHASFKDQPIRIISTIHRSKENTFCIANKAKGINSPADLKGKTIAVPVGTNAEYAFSAFLTQSKLDSADIKILNLSPPEMAGAITKNGLDAVVAWQPHIGRCAKILGDSALAIAFDTVYEETYNLVTSKLMADSKKEICAKILRAINRAVDFMKANPEEAIGIVSRRIGMDQAELTNLWKIYHFGLNLNEDLVATMQKEGTWAVKKGHQTGTVPDMRRFISTDALKEVAKDSVKVK